MPNVNPSRKPAHSFHGQNALTVDVEDYFQVSAFAPYVDRNEWDDFECRLPANMERILATFEAAEAKGTFFFLGWVAEKFPELLRRVADLGHEIGSHGYQHIRVCEQNENQFRQDVDRTRKVLEDISGTPVYGYRAASFSIDANNTWARDVLANTGHQYSSSIYPIRHDRYGMRDAPRFPWRASDGGVVELPVTTVEVLGARLPCGGGGYFRLLPYTWTHWGINHVNTNESHPAIFYFHPWELDPDQPILGGLDRLSRFRHYVNLKSFEKKLTRLLHDLKWTTVVNVFRDEIGSN